MKDQCIKLLFISTSMHHFKIQKVDYWLPWAERRGKWGVTTSGYGVSFWGNENLLKIRYVIAKFCEYTKNHCIVHLKWVNFMVYEL